MFGNVNPNNGNVSTTGTFWKTHWTNPEYPVPRFWASYYSQSAGTWKTCYPDQVNAWGWAPDDSACSIGGTTFWYIHYTAQDNIYWPRGVSMGLRGYWGKHLFTVTALGVAGDPNSWITTQNNRLGWYYWNDYDEDDYSNGGISSCIYLEANQTGQRSFWILGTSFSR